jgi:hypothetical protein
MKLELFEETDNLTGDKWYFTRKGGVTVTGSLKSDYHEAKKAFELIKNNNKTTEKILEVYETE